MLLLHFCKIKFNALGGEFHIEVILCLEFSRVIPPQKLNPLRPNISMDILHMVLCSFGKVLTRRICVTIRSFFGWMIISFISVTFMCDIVRRNKMLVTLTGLKVKNLPREEGWDMDMF